MSQTPTPSRASRPAAFALIVVAYVLAGLTGWFFTRTNADVSPLYTALIADAAATVVIFAFSLLFRNGSFYDAYWSVAPFFIALYWWLHPAADADSLRAALVLILLTAWGVRLTWNWARGWTGLDHEDWRYGELRKQTGIFYPIVNFLGIHFFPTLMVFAGMLPVYVALFGPARPFSLLDVVATLVTLGAINIETLADEQLRAFRQSSPAPEATLESGLWKYSRHPNYFGEIGFWLGMCLFGLAADPAQYWTASGIVAMILMFRFISLPMIEKRMKSRRPAYAERVKRVSAIVPWPVKKG